MRLPEPHRICSVALMLVLVFGTTAQSEDAPSDAARPDVLLADFEAETYGDWTATGTAFGTGPARGTLPRQMHVEGFEGRGLVNSFLNGDGSIGTLISPPFTIDRDYINFLIGGGGYADKTCIRLKIGDDVVRTATGPNTAAGGSERLDWESWDVSEFSGKVARIEIVDSATGGWGHINIDHIVQSDMPRGTAVETLELTVSNHYLHLPVKNGAPKRRVTLAVNNRTVRDFEIELPPGEEPADFMVFVDVREFIGGRMTLTTRLPETSTALQQVAISGEIPAAEGVYREALRPQFHFTSRRGWLNDPNGLVYLDGEWHLFYQHNPYGWGWGNMHWGHAVSGDLLHWRELGAAILPRWDDWAFSGSAVFDKNNSSGFGTNASPPLVAAFTSTGRGECIVFSTDRGRSWNEFEGNPVVKHAGRDPRLLWHAKTSQWVMAVYDETAGARDIVFHTSPDLKSWTERSRVSGFYECPDLFELPDPTVNGQSLWVLHAADGKYVLGDFDGERFLRKSPDKEGDKHQLWFGNFYAAQTYTNTPNGRVVQIGWGQGIEFPEMPFNQQMTIPVELSLAKTAEGVRMSAVPVKELEAIRGATNSWNGLTVSGTKPLEGLSEVAADGFEVRLQIAAEAGMGNDVGIDLRGVPIRIDRQGKTLRVDRTTAPLPEVSGSLDLHILVDRGSVEVFAAGGRVAVSQAVRWPAGKPAVTLVCEKGAAKFERVEVTELKSVWTTTLARP